MWYPATVTAPPTSEPVLLMEVKAQSRVEGDDEDGYLAGLLAAARGHVESSCGIYIMPQTVVLKCDSFGDFERVPVAPVSAVQSIAYLDTNGAAQTLSSTVYEARIEGLTPSIVLKSGQSWPDIQPGSRITVTVTAGASKAPEPVRHAILLLTAHWFTNREAVGPSDMMPIPLGVDALLANSRRYGF